MSFLGKLPVVSLLLAAMMLAVPFVLEGDRGPSIARFEAARGEARVFYERNSRLEVGSMAELILGSEWLAETREGIALSGSAGNSIDLPARMLARSQARLDGLIEQAYQARLFADPAWRLGVLDGATPPRNFYAHTFVHEGLAGLLLCMAVLLLVAAPLERAWSSTVMAAFVAIVVPLTAQGFRILDSSSGIPWSGSAGLAGALLGAYFIRGLGGHFMLPGWLLLPVWLGAETFVVQEFWIDDLWSVPWATLFAAIGLGALCAGGLRLLDIEAKIGGMRSRVADRAPNPVIARAARLRTDGDPHQAFDLIQAAWREAPRDEAVAECFFDIAVEVGEPVSAAEAILPSLRGALKSGDVERALGYWLPLARAEADVRMEATALVRLGEALLDAGHPDQALYSLRSALDSGVSGAHATRIVRIARDLDDGLARRAAHIALADVTLDPKSRAELEPIATPIPDGSPEAPTQARQPDSPAPQPITNSLDRRVAAEHHPVETTQFPVEEDLDLDETRVATEGSSTVAMETAVVSQGLDPGALSADQLEASASEEAPDATQLFSEPEPSGDVLSHWNEDDLDAAEASDLEPDGARTQLFEGAGLDLEGDDIEFDLIDETSPLDDLSESMTDSDMTPLVMDETDEMTNPLLSPPDEAPTLVTSPESVADEGPAATVAMMSDSASDSSTAAYATGASSAVDPNSAEQVQDFAIGVESAAETKVTTLRVLKVIDAVPTDMAEDSIEIDADGKGKSRLPLARIHALAMGAVPGLASRPVLLVDFVLNWNDESDAPLKLIRLRSDRFDPRDFEANVADALEALTIWVRRIQAQSGATCLPTQQMLDGQFAHYEDLETYEREVLFAVREPA